MTVCSNSLHSDLHSLVNSQTRSDVKFLIGKEEVVFYGHSQILAARSSYFDTALQPSWKEASEGIFRKPNVEPRVFRLVLEHLYTGRITVSMDIVSQLVDAAVELHLDELLSGCVDYACSKIAHDNVCELLILASRHDLERLWTDSIGHFDHHANIILKRNDILAFDPDLLLKILSRDTILIDELAVWEAVVRYAYHENGLDHTNCEILDLPKWPGRMLVETFPDSNIEDETVKPDDVVVHLSRSEFLGLRSTITTLLPAVRLTSLEVTDFVQCIESTGLVSPDICRRVYRYHALPKTCSSDFALAPRRQHISLLLPHDQWRTLWSWVTGVADETDSSDKSSRQGTPETLYRASSHGFSASAFHKHCDNQGPTVTVSVAASGIIVGGFNASPWDSNGTFSYSSASFIFCYHARDIQLKRHHIVYSRTAAACNIATSGPIFGEGYDFRITGDGKGSTVSASTYGNWKPRHLASTFDVVDYEVFAVR